MDSPDLEAPAGISRARLLITLLAVLVPCFIASLVLLRRTLRAHNTIKKIRASKAAASDRVLLIGPSDGGKTALWATWTAAQPPASKSARSALARTVPSLKSAKAPFTAETPLAEKLPRADLVDLPGHPKLQRETQEQLATPGTKAIVFVLDASASQEAMANCAAVLYDALVVAEQRQLPLLVAANKGDLFNTTSPRRIMTILEQALDEQRTVRSRKIADADANDNEFEDDDKWIGLVDQPFKFKQLETAFDLIDGSVKDGRTRRWADWIIKSLD